MTAEHSALPAEQLQQILEASVVTNQPLEAAVLEELVEDEQSGAVATFRGVVRNHDPEATGEVTGLEYSAHPDATSFLQDVVHRFNVWSKNPADETQTPIRVAAAHRIGELSVGEVALVVAVSAAHRQEAFATLAAVVDAIKAEVPIWKKQFTNESSHWVGI